MRAHPFRTAFIIGLLVLAFLVILAVPLTFRQTKTQESKPPVPAKLTPQPPSKPPPTKAFATPPRTRANDSWIQIYPPLDPKAEKPNNAQPRQRPRSTSPPPSYRIYSAANKPSTRWA
jgi:hypothetical protein